MGSAQSARRIQPGGVVRPCRRSGGSFPRPVPPGPSTRPPSPAVPPPSSSLPGGERARGGLRRVRGRAGGAGGGVCGGPPPGRRPAAAGRISTAAVRRDRLRDGWEGRRGRWPGGPPLRPLLSGGGGRRGPPPGCYSPPAAALAESRGRGSQTRRRALPPPGAHPRGGLPREGVPLPRGRAGVPGGPGRPSHGATAPPPPRPRPPPPPSRAATVAAGRGGGADCPQCAPGGSRRRARGVSRRHAVTKAQRSERTGSAAMSATHPTRLVTRTKESNTCASQGLARKPPWRNEGEGRRARARAARRPRWDPEASPVRRGRTTGPSRPPRRGGGA